MFSKLYSKLRFLQVSVQKRLFNKEACHWRSWSELSFKHRTSRSFVSFICRQTPGLLSLFCALLLPFQKQHYRKYNHHTTTFFTEINSVEPEKSKSYDSQHFVQLYSVCDLTVLCRVGSLFLIIILRSVLQYSKSIEPLIRNIMIHILGSAPCHEYTQVFM